MHGLVALFKSLVIIQFKAFPKHREKCFTIWLFSLTIAFMKNPLKCIILFKPNVHRTCIGALAMALTTELLEWINSSDYVKLNALIFFFAELFVLFSLTVIVLFLLLLLWNRHWFFNSKGCSKTNMNITCLSHILLYFIMILIHRLRSLR